MFDHYNVRKYDIRLPGSIPAKKFWYTTTKPMMGVLVRWSHFHQSSLRICIPIWFDGHVGTNLHKRSALLFGLMVTLAPIFKKRSALLFGLMVTLPPIFLKDLYSYLVRWSHWHQSSKKRSALLFGLMVTLPPIFLKDLYSYLVRWSHWHQSS